MKSLRALAERVRRELTVWQLVLKDRRTPWLAKALLWFAVAYALLPFDLIPDFIPVLGYVDDVMLVGVPVVLALKLVPRQVIEDARRHSTSG